MSRPDVARVLEGLKDFQRQTVEHVFRRMYLDDDRVRRFLLADEVGLGKTLVTRGVAALAVDHLWDTTDRIDVVYICSNNDIARQNVNRLRFSDDDEFTLATRITLLPVQIDSLRDRRLNFVSFTPGTSFDLKSRMGVAEERVLLYRMLRERWGLEGKTDIEIFRGDVEGPRFKRHIKNHEVEIDERIASDFGARMARDEVLHARYEALAEKLAVNRDRLTSETTVERRELIADLRAFLSATCLEALEPDLIILDEFQRFKHLLTGEDESSRLARRLFNYSDGKTDARLLLVSATPYKMYSVADELESDDHYRDFIATVEFLTEDPARTLTCKVALSDYRRSLLRLPDDGPAPLHRAKAALESELRRVMVRTERLAVAADRDGMLVERPCDGVALSSDDVVDFVHLERIAEKLEEPGTLEYWKSAPYVLSFMDAYNLKRAATDAVDAGSEGEGRLSDALRARPGLSVSWPDIEGYRGVSSRSPRLRWLADTTIGRGASQLLWMPPSKASYAPGGPYSNSRLAGFTKRLVFSSWNVVPKAIASLLSYEAERLIMTAADPAVENTAEARRKRRALLKFTRTKDKHVTAMPSMVLFYPSFALAELGDPRSSEREVRDWTADGWITEVASRIEGELLDLPIETSTRGNEDDDWYWAAPVLLDLKHDPAATRAWLANVQLAADWVGGKVEDAKEEDDADESSDVGWRAHVEQLTRAVDLSKLGRPPGDLAQVLARAAVAGPGVAALRALSRITGGRASLTDQSLRMSAAQLGWGFRTLFSSPEAMSLLRRGAEETPYWKLVLQYSVDGDLSAALEEYAHILRESLGLGNRNRFEAASEIAAHVRQVLALRTSTLEVDSLEARQGRRVVIDSHRMRTRFAMRFGEQTTDEVEAGRLEGGQVERTRATQVRDAFNSPFWPFVLASTSVGQEGLDFHQYCHAVVHWNLPNNPVDLEQREGRVHRYKGHAIRKNVALAFGDHGTTVTADRELADPWEVMFRAARAANAGSSELVPYWVLPVKGGATIERYVPALPLSRDRAKYTALVRALALYRMAFGQSRQEDMVNYLLRSMPADRLASILEEVQIDLSPRSSSVEREPLIADDRVWLPPSRGDTPTKSHGSKRVPKPPQGEQLDRARNDWHVAKQVFEAALPREAQRRAVESLFADSIRAAHEVSPSGWGITLFGGGSAYIRLNVASIEALALGSTADGRLSIAVRPRVFATDVRDQLFNGTTAYMRRGVTYTSEPKARVVFLGDEDLDYWLPIVRDAHLTMVREAASHVKTRSAWAKHHSSGILDYFGRENLLVPTPIY